MRQVVHKATAPKLPPLGPTERAVRDAILRAVRRIRDQTVRLDIERALEANDVQGAIDAIRWDAGEDVLMSILPAQYRDAYELAGDTGARDLSRLLRGSVNLRFDIINPHAVDFIRARSGELIRDFGESSQQAVRDLVERAFRNGMGPAQLAREILDTGIGLTRQQAIAVENYRRRLEDDENMDLSDEQVDARTERYYGSLLHDRSEMIARTEIILASREGLQESWRQAEEEGLIGPAAAQVWIATEDERECPICEELDGETAPLGAQFPGEGGSGPPAHPNCRCSLGMLPDVEQ